LLNGQAGKVEQGCIIYNQPNEELLSANGVEG